MDVFLDLFLNRNTYAMHRERVERGMYEYMYIYLLIYQSYIAYLCRSLQDLDIHPRNELSAKCPKFSRHQPARQQGPRQASTLPNVMLHVPQSTALGKDGVLGITWRKKQALSTLTKPLVSRTAAQSI